MTFRVLVKIDRVCSGGRLPASVSFVLCVHIFGAYGWFECVFVFGPVMHVFHFVLLAVCGCELLLCRCLKCVLEHLLFASHLRVQWHESRCVCECVRVRASLWLRANANCECSFEQ